MANFFQQNQKSIFAPSLAPAPLSGAGRSQQLTQQQQQQQMQHQANLANFQQADTSLIPTIVNINPPHFSKNLPIPPPPTRQLSYQEQQQKIIKETEEQMEQYQKQVEVEQKQQEIKKLKDRKVQNKTEKIPICELHPKTMSKNCRKCKKIMDIYNVTQNGGVVQAADNDENYQLIENIFGANGKDENIFKIAGNSATGNLNPRLSNSILSNEYFKNLYSLKTFHEVIDELQKSSTHAQPWAVGAVGIPSSFFCCLYKFMTMRLTVKQVKNLIDYKLNPMVRLAGFLYIRYSSDPEYLWAWVKRYLLDDETCAPCIDREYTITIGEYVEKLLMEQEYYGTRLPRIPVKIDIKIKAKLLITQEKRDRKVRNLQIFSQFQKEAKVKAISRIDDEWHFGHVENITGRQVIVKFIDERTLGIQNLFTGGEELINLGEIELLNVDNFYQALNPMKRSESEERQKYNDSSSNNNNIKQRRSVSRSYSEDRNKKKSRKSDKRNKHDRGKKKRHSSRSRDRSYSSSRYSSSRSRSDSRDKKRRNRSRSRENNKRDNNKNIKMETNKEKEQRIYEELKRRQKENSVAYNRSEVARVPTSYKTALGGLQSQYRNRSISPRRDSKIIDVVLPNALETKKVVEDSKRQGPSQQFLDNQAKLMQRYGGSGANNNSDYQ